LWPWNRGAVHFISHKVFRLLMPFALVALLASTFWLPAPLRTILLAGQGVVYGLALIYSLLPSTFPFKRISAAASAFVVLMAAALYAPVAAFLPARHLWKQTAIRQPQT